MALPFGRILLDRSTLAATPQKFLRHNLSNKTKRQRHINSTDISLIKHRQEVAEKACLIEIPTSNPQDPNAWGQTSQNTQTGSCYNLRALLTARERYS